MTEKIDMVKEKMGNKISLNKKKNNQMIAGALLLLGVVIILAIAASNLPFVMAAEQTVCCEKTIQGFYCQNVPASQCAEGAKQIPTACESTSICKGGYCFDSSEGTCVSNTPQLVCNQNKGVWSADSPAQCQLGCCSLGDQAAFVTLTRCKKLASFLGLQTSFNKGTANEVACIASVQGRTLGACVYTSDFEKTCKFATQAECSGGINGTLTKGTFYAGKLCSAEELATNCGPTQKTICPPGKDGVYFADSCGNPANIYDASKINDKEYWGNLKDPTGSCSPASNNANSKTCGNCNYLQGSICRSASSKTGNPNYGDNICADLNCVDETGKKRIHGESWCSYTDKGAKEGANAVGSRFYKQTCSNGEIIVEACEDYRQEICIEDTIETAASGKVSQAACRANEWRDCALQITQKDCENAEKRDCVWLLGVPLLNSQTIAGGCIPKYSPGNKFWEGEDAKTSCKVGSYQCRVKMEKGLIGSWTCTENCNCLLPAWKTQRALVCESLGDCGMKINFVGDKSSKKDYNIVVFETDQ